MVTFIVRVATVCVCARACVCVRACVYVRACVHACVHIGPCVHARVACTFETHARTHLTGDEAGSHPDGSFARAPSLCPPSSFPPATIMNDFEFK